ncbi:hypothetical protein M2323_001881 [Rhodoblastus acidophilus]|uniref:DUF5666 domain-containing protein n=1 Tax=Rhodoblastus acidophilus TaxID=1074 RepID=UPI0022246052|nr:DUF5666 domain-containing protein [Rhodoblastus acidophilus]MCW2283687.1 hypothetical protein [Rhodoblastus acidophilus]MCW2332964.1 hypothetical protein [Rhodoblastus acidophilus]
MTTSLSRRALFSAALTLLAGEALGGRRDRDRGIGGTGAPGARPDPDEDRGIGGTGVVGTIRKFGSIVVNDMRIGYSLLTRVEIDGRPATPAELRIGQVVQTVANSDGAGFETDRIIVTSEVVGPIEHAAPGRLIVLGQTVATHFVEAAHLRKGQWIAVSGLRDLGGVIHASHIQNRDTTLAQVAGPVRVKKGVARIGGLALVNLDPSLEGCRVLARVGRLDGKPAVVSVTPDPEGAALPNVRRLCLESYVARSGDQLRMGSGLVAAARGAAGSASGRAVIMVTIGPNGGMTATAQRPIAEPDTTPPSAGGPQQRGASPARPADARTDKRGEPAMRGDAPAAGGRGASDGWRGGGAPASNNADSGSTPARGNWGDGRNGPATPQTHSDPPPGWPGHGGHGRR